MTPKEDLNLQIDKLASLLKRDGAHIEVNAKLGISFGWKDDVRLSILRSGVMIAEGISSRQETIRVYKMIVSDLMDVPWSRIKP